MAVTSAKGKASTRAAAQRLAASRSSKATGSASSSSSRKVNYNFDSTKESASQYNARIAAERGDSAASLSRMQRTTANTFRERGLDANKVGGAITAADLAPTEKIALPPPVVTPVPDIAANNVGLVDPATGVTTSPSGMLTVTDPNDKYAGATAIQNDFQAALDRLNNEAPSAADIQRQLEKETGLRRKQQAVNDFTAQLNTIVANRDANKLKLEGQGRGITDVIIGGQQAQIDKEAAIAALPVQAQLAAAQGNLQLAQDHIATWGNILMKDAENQYNRKKEVLTSVRDFAVGIEFKRIDDLERANERKYQEARDLTNAKTSALSLALGQGAPSSVVNAIKSAMTLEDVTAAAGVYNGDVLGQAIKQEELNALRTPTGGGSLDAPTIKTINGVDYQWNASTGTWEVPGIAGGATGAGGQSLENLETKYTELIKDIGDAKKLAESGALGAGYIERKLKGAFTSNTDFNQIANISDTIKANLLTLNTDPNIKKFFGPQMSNRDTELMTGAASTLNSEKQTPEQYIRDLQDAAGVIARAREAVRVGLGQQSTSGAGIGANIILAPDGTPIELID